MDHIEIGRRLLKLPGVRILYDAQIDMNAYRFGSGGDLRGDTHFISTGVDDPEAEVFTHYLSNPWNLSEADESDLSYYNACSYGEETRTLEEQRALVRERFPDYVEPDATGGSDG